MSVVHPIAFVPGSFFRRLTSTPRVSERPASATLVIQDAFKTLLNAHQCHDIRMGVAARLLSRASSLNID